MVSAQRNGGANATPQREEKRTETTAAREGITVRIVTLQLLNGGRHNLKYVSISMGLLSYSIHIQLFSQNQSLLSPISNQIIIKRVTRNKKTTTEAMTTTTTDRDVTISIHTFPRVS